MPLSFRDYHLNGYKDEDDRPVEPLPPELSDDYLASKARQDEYFRLMEEGLTIFDELYWAILFEDLKHFFTTWTKWAKVEVFKMSIALMGCITAGCVLMAFLGIILSVIGPLRIKTLGMLLLGFIIGSMLVTEGVDVAASSVVGMALMIYLFFGKVSTGSKLERGRLVKGYFLSGRNEPPVFMVVSFWYGGERMLWINLSGGYVGLA